MRFWAMVAAALALSGPAMAQPAGGAVSNQPSNTGGSTANQAQQNVGSGQNQAASVTQPGMAQTNNSGQSQTGNYGTGMAGGRSDTNPFPAPK